MRSLVEYTESSGNVFADLGLEHANELFAKSALAHKILEVIRDRGFTQAQAAKALGTHQTQISRLKTGEGKDSMSFDLLLDWLTKLDCDVTLTVHQKKARQAVGQIRVSV